MSAGQQALMMTMAPPGPTDPYYNNVTLLLHMDGSNGSTTFIDNSPSPKTMSPFGNTNINTTIYKYGTGSAYFDGTSDGIYATSNDFKFGTQDFTIEFWLNIANLGSFQQKAIAVNDRSNSDSWQFYKNFDHTLSLRMNNMTPFNNINTTVAANPNTWYFIAATRQSNRIRFFVDGVDVDPLTTYTNTTNFFITPDIIIGNSVLTASNAINGYIDDFRITKGVARYTSNFTPPTAPFPNS